MKSFKTKICLSVINYFVILTFVITASLLDRGLSKIFVFNEEPLLDSPINIFEKEVDQCFPEDAPDFNQNNYRCACAGVFIMLMNGIFMSYWSLFMWEITCGIAKSVFRYTNKDLLD